MSCLMICSINKVYCLLDLFIKCLWSPKAHLYKCWWNVHKVPFHSYSDEMHIKYHYWGTIGIFLSGNTKIMGTKLIIIKSCNIKVSTLLSLNSKTIYKKYWDVSIKKHQLAIHINIIHLKIIQARKKRVSESFCTGIKFHGLALAGKGINRNWHDLTIKKIIIMTLTKMHIPNSPNCTSLW